MTRIDIDIIVNDIIKAYHDIDSPSFYFALERDSENIYKHFLEKVGRRFKIINQTDLNYDVCYSYLIEGTRVVSLSHVGKYAILLKLMPRALPKLISYKDKHEEIDKVVIDFLKEENIQLLDKETLEKNISLSNLDNTPKNHATIYNALFSDTYPLPWH